MVPNWNTFLLACTMFTLAACGSPAPPNASPTVAAEATSAPASATAHATEMPTDAPLPMQTPTAATAAELSFNPALYRDESAGYELDYPVEWTLDPSSQVGVRGGQALLLSPGTTVETIAEGGTRLSLVTNVWDPKNDLDAYVAQRKTAWDASGFAIEREETWQLEDGRAAHIFVIQTPEQPSFVLLTTVGEDYLQIGGEGDLALVEEIARTLRPAGS